jgi:predicted RNA-binding Zn ribbon-like protein
LAHYTADAAEVAVRLANTLDVESGEDTLQTPEDLAVLIRAELGDVDGLRPGDGDRDLRFARTLRSHLRSVWEARDADGAAAAINEILELVGARPRIAAPAPGGGPPRLRFVPATDDPLRRLVAIAALGLSLALIEGGWDRFGTCASSACDDVYVDSSRNRSRLYCSETCTTRESVAAYRARHRAAG